MIYALLAVPLRSYVQPLLIMSAIPFGVVGAIWGHLIMGMNLTILSMFGLVALTGVVVNDSLVMVDFINRHRDEEGDLLERSARPASARFRPILLTSLTRPAPPPTTPPPQRTQRKRPRTVQPCRRKVSLLRGRNRRCGVVGGGAGRLSAAIPGLSRSEPAISAPRRHREISVVQRAPARSQLEQEQGRSDRDKGRVAADSRPAPPPTTPPPQRTRRKAN